MSAREPIRNRTVSNHVYEVIKTMIDQGVLHPGEKVLRKKLEEQLRVSQTPINEALSRLAAEKLLDQKSRQGYYVATCSDEELVDLFAIRSAIEGIAARLCAEEASDEEIADLTSHFADFTCPLDADEYARYKAEDKVFHEKIILYSHNDAIKDMYANNGYVIKSYQRGLVRPPDETIGEHRELIAAFVARDAHKAWIIATEHQCRSRDVLRHMTKLSTAPRGQRREDHEGQS